MHSPWRRIVMRRRPRAPFANLIASMQRRLREEPGNLKLRQSLATHLGRARRYGEAIEEAERLIEIAPSSPKAKRLLIGLRIRRLLDRPVRH